MHSPADLLDGTASYGYWIRRRRQALDMTQAMLARQVGCATITIQKIEYEERRPSRQMAVRLAESLAIPENERATFIASVLGEALLPPLPIDTHPLILSTKRPVDAPHVAKAAWVPTNLPHPLTSFVGRKAELAQLDALLNQHDVRLITITGPGGMGKTRLALALAQCHLADERFADGIYFVSLSPIRDPDHIVIALATALSLTLHFGDPIRTPQQQLLDYVRARAMLLIFDNFEHLLDGVALVAQILHVASQVKALVTSREWLRIPGEHLFPIRGLAFNATNTDGPVAASEAVQLFVQSARRTLPPQVVAQLEERQSLVTEGEMALVVHICRLVDGMPLGIELAASWSALLSFAEIAEEIQRSLDFLTAERRGSRAEHQSIRAVFESSWRQLHPAHQAVFSRLALFRSGFTRQAAEAVAGASLRILEILLAKSLLQYERERGRYTLHELLRQYAEEKLLADAKGADETHERFCAYYTTFLQQQEACLIGQQQLDAIAAIEVEIENIRLAWEWAVTHHQIEYIDRGLNALNYFYHTKSWYDEGFHRFRSTVKILDAEAVGREGVVLGRVLARQASMLASVDYAVAGATVREEARALCQRSLSIFERLGTRSERIDPLYWLGTLALSSGDIEQAVCLFKEALALSLEQNESWKTAIILRGLGSCYAATGEYEQAIDYHKRAVSVCSDTGDMRSLGATLYELADALRAAGEYHEARMFADRALTISTAAGAKRNTAHILRILGEVAWQMGDYAAAHQSAQASLMLMQELRLARLQDAPLVILGKAAGGLGKYEQAKAYFYRVLESHQQAGTLNESHYVADAAVGLADVLAKEGQKEQALKALKLALHHPTVWHETKQQAVKLLTSLTHQLTSR